MKKLIILIQLIVPIFANAHFKFEDMGSRSIYSLDDRELITEETVPTILKYSRSVGMIFLKDDLIPSDTADNSSIIFTNLLSDNPPIGGNYCPSEKFAEHHAYKRGCTGFLIAKDIMLTAGHCFKSKNDCHRKFVAFDVRSANEVGKGFKVGNRDIYKCEKIVAQVYDPENTGVDFAIIKLDHKTDRPVLRVREAKKIDDHAKLFMIGHPLGLPLIYSKNAIVMDNISENFFKASLDSFHGNSGSPVFNVENGWVEGVLVRGEVDDEYDQSQKCSKYLVYSEDDLSRGEGVTRMSAILPYLRNSLGPTEPEEDQFIPELN